ncbi:MAG: hypothetical protein MI861_15480, partial [Pirellulales bacterium]|nr:hypothetical protein [Pirellulales bacterium]
PQKTLPKKAAPPGAPEPNETARPTSIENVSADTSPPQHLTQSRDSAVEQFQLLRREIESIRPAADDGQPAGSSSQPVLRARR